MIIYSVKIKIDITVEAEWLVWMRDVYIPGVIKTGYFNNAVIFRELSESPESNLSAYEIHYRTENLEDFIKFTENAAPALQKLHSERFGGKYIAERTILVEA